MFVWRLREDGNYQYDSEQLVALFNSAITSESAAGDEPTVVVCRYTDIVSEKIGQNVFQTCIPKTHLQSLPLNFVHFLKSM